MNLENKTTAELEARDSALTKDRQALCSFANRKLSIKARTILIEAIREEQDAIMHELMNREKVGA
jgi:hypothetical protein